MTSLSLTCVLYKLMSFDPFGVFFLTLPIPLLLLAFSHVLFSLPTRTPPLLRTECADQAPPLSFFSRYFKRFAFLTPLRLRITGFYGFHSEKYNRRLRGAYRIDFPQTEGPFFLPQLSLLLIKLGPATYPPFPPPSFHLIMLERLLA